MELKKLLGCLKATKPGTCTNQGLVVWNRWHFLFMSCHHSYFNPMIESHSSLSANGSRLSPLYEVICWKYCIYISTLFLLMSIYTLLFSKLIKISKCEEPNINIYVMAFESLLIYHDFKIIWVRQLTLFLHLVSSQSTLYPILLHLIATSHYIGLSIMV